MVMMTTNSDFEIEQLNFSLNHEISIRNNLEKENEDIQKNLISMENQQASVSNDPNRCEWGRKYLAQTEINGELLKQIKSMEEKMSQLQDTEPNDFATNNNAKLNDTDLRNLLRQLEKEKRVLEGNLKDTEWRLDSESQELFRLNEEKEKYRLDVNKITYERKPLNKPITKRSVSPILGSKFGGSKSLNGANMKTRQYGIPDNHRILDARLGPVKKTAAVKTLPRITNASPQSAGSIMDKKNKLKTKKSVDSLRNQDERSGAATT